MAIRLKDARGLKIPGLKMPDMPGHDREPRPRRNKYGNQRTACGHGHVHDSKAEARRCNELVLLQRSGAIRGLDQQPRFYFTDRDGQQLRDERGRAIRFTPDFRYEERTSAAGEWRPVVEDVKSAPTRTQVFVLRATLFRNFHPDIELRIVS